MSEYNLANRVWVIFAEIGRAEEKDENYVLTPSQIRDLKEFIQTTTSMFRRNWTG